MEFGNVNCFSCRKLFEQEERQTPCEINEICYYTKTENEPPKLDGYAFIAWDMWNTKELLGEGVLTMKLEKYSGLERELLIELLKEIEVLALKYELKKQPKNCIGGF